MKIERIKAIYTELGKYSIELHADPRSMGPVYLNDLISTCRNYLNSVSRVQLEVHQEKQYLSRTLRAEEAACQVAFDDLLANDERVRRLPSIEDRKATASVFLRDQKNSIDNVKAELQDVEFVEKAIRHTHRELTSTMSEIKLQRSLIRDEIDTGAMYGDERDKTPRSRVQSPENPDYNDDAELERILNGAGESLASPEPVPDPEPYLGQAIVEAPPAPVEAPPAPVPPLPVPVVALPPEDDDAAIVAFLEGGEKPVIPAPSGDFDDFADVLENV